jgi:hypothetical protein
MSQVMSLVRGHVAGEALDEIRTRYAAGVSGDRPPGLEATWLLARSDGSVAVATIWRDRAAIDAMAATGEEPFARRLIREAGGTPTVEFFDVLEGSGTGAEP